MWTLAFWKGAGERAIKTFFQVFVATIGVNVVGAQGFGLEDINWIMVLSVSLVAAILSVATSIGNAEFTAGLPAGRHAIYADHSTPRGNVSLDGL